MTEPAPTLYITKQGIYHCNNCDHTGVAERVTLNRWRWWHYITSLLFFPLGLIFTYLNTGPTRRCAKCHANKVQRVRYEKLPKPPPPNDPDTIRNRLHRRIAIIVTILIAIIVPFANGFIQGWNEATREAEQQQQEQNVTDSANVILQADYTEGHKAGYVDGRSALGNLADSYAAPATEERAQSYAEGYLVGFKLGCDEGGFDCTEQLRELEADHPETDATYQ